VRDGHDGTNADAYADSVAVTKSDGYPVAVAISKPVAKPIAISEPFTKPVT
jgi:hypothetical protein